MYVSFSSDTISAILRIQNQGKYATREEKLCNRAMVSYPKGALVDSIIWALRSTVSICCPV
jgi:hypothetical protein